MRGLTWASTDIVESEVSNARVELEEEGQRLANATGGTEDGDLGELDWACQLHTALLRPSAVYAETGCGLLTSLAEAVNARRWAAAKPKLRAAANIVDEMVEEEECD